MAQFRHQLGSTMTIAGAQIYYECHGLPASPTLVVLHGGFQQMEVFNPLLEALSDHYQLIGIDSRGHGRSTLGDVPLSYQQLQKDVEVLLAALGITHCQILGFSDGGIVGYRLASLSQSLNIDKLFTIGARWHIEHALVCRDAFLATTAEQRQHSQPQVYQRYQQLNPEADFPRLVKQLVTMWLDPTESGYPNEQVDAIDCPLLVARGDDDPLIARSVVFDIAQRLTQAQLCNVPFAKHMAFADQPLIFRQLLAQFFQVQ
ncbi:alpha/beta fold hydrolase [Celerinatantimonas yamalensis]|uniref:Alpha/beta hydrolase n=1 Tax=Celerinatantimonas yamalensis TaxID=559956 RepID=A0ABW9G8X6_9GAMM